MLAEGDQTMEKKKTEGQKLEKELSYKKENFFVVSSDEKIKAAFDYAEDYKKYIDLSKTEREAVKRRSLFARKKDIRNIASATNSKPAADIITTTEARVLPFSKSVPPTSERTE